MANRAGARTGILQGTLDLMVLQTLATMGPRHGYALGARIEQVSRGAIQVNMGTLYPALMRLEQRRLIRGEWATTDNNRRARFYAITAAGQRELGAERAEWDRMVDIIQALAQDPEPPAR
jgi:transcriptional regulator